MLMLYSFLTGKNHDGPDKKSKATEQVKIQISNYDDEENKHRHKNNHIQDEDDNDSGPTSLHLSSIICSEHHSSNEHNGHIIKEDFSPPALSNKKLVPIGNSQFWQFSTSLYTKSFSDDTIEMIIRIPDNNYK